MDPDIWKPEIYFNANENPRLNTAIIAVTSTSCILSILGSILIIATFLAWRDLRTTARLLLVYLSIADLLAAASYLYGTLRNYSSSTWDCIIQSAVSTFANIASYFWTICISLYIYVLIVKADKNEANGMVIGFHILSWGLPLVVVGVALTQHGLGYDASYISVGWCWVDLQNHFFLLWMLVAGKLWEIIAYIFLPVMYFLVKRHIHIQTSLFHELPPARQRTMKLMTQVDTKLTLIPLVFILLRVWSTARFLIYLAKNKHSTSATLILLHGVGNTFQGAANCILFCFMTDKVRKRLISTFCRCCLRRDREHRPRSPEERPRSPRSPRETSPLLRK